MSYNGSGTFTINSTGQPVVAGTVITASAFNALTTDLATGLTTAITKDGQTTTTARITFAQGITSSLVTDSSSVSTGSIITDGGVGIAKNLYVGGTLNVTGSTSLTNPVINNIKMGYTTTATAAGTTTLTISSNYRQFFTGTTTQTIVLPVTSTLVTGIAYEIENNSTGLLTVNSSGGNLVGTVPAGVCAHAVCIGTTLTTAADWDWDYISTTTITGTGANVLATSPTITTPTISSLSSASATALTLQSAGTTAITVDTSQNVGIGTSSPNTKLEVVGAVRATNSGSSGYFYRGYRSGTTSAWYVYDSGTEVQMTVEQANPLLFGTNNTERMRIDSSGNVGIGTTATTTYRTTIANNGGNQLRLYATDVASSTTNTIDFWYLDGGGSPYNNTSIRSLSTANAGNGNLVFYTRPTSGSLTEAMRIDSSGNLLVGTTSADGKLAIHSTSTTAIVGYFSSDTASYTGSHIQTITQTASGTGFNHLICYSNTGGTVNLKIIGNGNVQNANNSYGAISDAKLKENIVDASPKLASLMQVKVRNYNLKTDQTHKQIGVIAQELEQIFPSMVEETPDRDIDGNDLGTTTKAVKYSVFVPMLIKAIQELKAINDSLTARIVALEAK
jgi:hypothetical protein